MMVYLYHLVLTEAVSSISVKTNSEESIETTTRTNDLNSSYNTYYTFTMPNDDVNINIYLNNNVVFFIVKY